MREVLLVMNSEITENIHGEEIVSPCVLQNKELLAINNAKQGQTKKCLQHAMLRTKLTW